MIMAFISATAACLTLQLGCSYGAYEKLDGGQGCHTSHRRGASRDQDFSRCSSAAAKETSDGTHVVN